MDSLGKFIVQRSADSTLVIAFFHQQFRTVLHSYLFNHQRSDSLTQEQAAEALARYFSGQYTQKFQQRGLSHQPTYLNTQVILCRGHQQYLIKVMRSNYSKQLTARSRYRAAILC